MVHCWAPSCLKLDHGRNGHAHVHETQDMQAAGKHTCVKLCSHEWRPLALVHEAPFTQAPSTQVPSLMQVELCVQVQTPSAPMRGSIHASVLLPLTHQSCAVPGLQDGTAGGSCPKIFLPEVLSPKKPGLALQQSIWP